MLPGIKKEPSMSTYLESSASPNKYTKSTLLGSDPLIDDNRLKEYDYIEAVENISI